MNPFSLEGKSILITGASSGIGAASAIECSKMGAMVYMTGRNRDRLDETLSKMDGKEHKIIECDLTIEDDQKRIISEITKLDGVVFSAGINQTVPLSFLSRKKINQIFEVNFFSQVELLRMLLKKKLLKEGSSVVTISSIGGNSKFTPGAAAYGASKAAIQSWMKTAARELAPKIRINCICPGHINTPMNTGGDVSEEQYEIYKASIPMKRFGEPEEIAYAVIYLLSDAANWITGSTISIDGGTTL